MASSVIDLLAASERLVSELIPGFDGTLTLIPFNLVVRDRELHYLAATDLSSIADKNAELIRKDTPAIDNYLSNRSGLKNEPAYERIKNIGKKIAKGGELLASIIQFGFEYERPRTIGIATQLAQLPKRVNEGQSIPAGTRTPVLNTGYFLDPSLYESHSFQGEANDRLPIGRAAAIAITRQAFECLKEPARAVTTPYVFMRAGNPELDSCSDLYRTGLFVRSGSSGLWEMPGLHAGEEYDLYVALADITKPEDVASAAAKY